MAPLSLNVDRLEKYHYAGQTLWIYPLDEEGQRDPILTALQALALHDAPPRTPFEMRYAPPSDVGREGKVAIVVGNVPRVPLIPEWTMYVEGGFERKRQVTD